MKTLRMRRAEPNQAEPNGAELNGAERSRLNVPFRSVIGHGSMAYLCFSFSHAISCGIVDINRCVAPKSIT